MTSKLYIKFVCHLRWQERFIVLTPASRTLRKQGLAVLALYFAVFFGTNFVVSRTHPAGPLLWFYAALPALPLIRIFVMLGQYLRAERDEYKRDLVIRCLLWGLAGAMSLHLFTGFLRIFAWSGQMPPFAELYVFTAFMLIPKISYRAANRIPADA